MKHFKHDPLSSEDGSIRLLCLRMDDQNPGIVKCTMRHATTTTRYTCLSYRWGDDLPANPILVNGTEFLVRSNLFSFLATAAKSEWQKKVQRLCGPERSEAYEERWFWIDALCIDQQNSTERNHQVQQMGKIFASAEQVFIWLGNTANRNLLSQCLVALPQDAYSVEEILFNEYWRRAWVTQEVVLARRAILLANKEAVEWKAFASELRNTIHRTFPPGRELQPITKMGH